MLNSGLTRRLILLAAIALVGAIYGLNRESEDQGGGSSVGGTLSGKVTSVADGDTLSVRAPNGRIERVRIIGINTPEIHGEVECGGPEAAAEMRRLADGATVTVIADPTQDRKDRFGRLLAYVELDGTDLGLEMIRRGRAIAYPFGRPFQRYPQYKQAESEARNARTGTWANCEIHRR